MTSRDLDADDLVRRAKEGLVSPAEVAEVARRLPDLVDEERAYQLLYVIGRTSSTEYENLVAEFLDARDNPMLARLALQTLCTFWGFTERYVERVRQFVDGVEWDHHGEVRQVAISAAGAFLRDHVDCGLLRGLLELGREDNPSVVDRRIALEAVAAALGYSTPEAAVVGRERWMAEVRAQGEARLATEHRPGGGRS